MRQTSFQFIKNYKCEFGGSLLQGKRKSKRPLSTKSPLHLVLKTKGYSLRRDVQHIERIIRHELAHNQIRLFDLSVNWDHIHMLIQLPSRDAYVRFIRILTSRLVTAISKNSNLRLNKSLAKDFCGAKGLFLFRPYTKIVTWGRQFINTLRYQTVNQFEAQFGSHRRYEFMHNKETILLE